MQEARTLCIAAIGSRTGFPVFRTLILPSYYSDGHLYSRQSIVYSEGQVTEQSAAVPAVEIKAISRAIAVVFNSSILYVGM